MKYYVYTLSRPDGSVFYVGKGSRKRVLHHERDARANRGNNPHKENVIRKIWREGGTVTRTTILTTDNEQEAFQAETELIASIGLDNLTNICVGGQGSSGPKMSIKAREAIGNAHRGISLTAEHKGKLSNAHSKTYPGFMSPDGTAYPNITNLKEFCQEQGLCQSPMYQVAKGVYSQNKGWRLLPQ